MKIPTVVRRGCKTSFGLKGAESLLRRCNLGLHRCKLNVGWCKRLLRDLCSRGPKDLFHPLLTIFGNFPCRPLSQALWFAILMMPVCVCVCFFRMVFEIVVVVVITSTSVSSVGFSHHQVPCGQKFWRAWFIQRTPEDSEHAMHISNLKSSMTPKHRNMSGNFCPVGLAQQTVENYLKYWGIHSDRIRYANFWHSSLSRNVSGKKLATAWCLQQISTLFPLCLLVESWLDGKMPLKGAQWALCFKRSLLT